MMPHLMILDRSPAVVSEGGEGSSSNRETLSAKPKPDSQVWTKGVHSGDGASLWEEGFGELGED